MSVSSYADDLGSAVHYALETTHAIAVCPFHLDLTIRIGDDAAESHAFARARKLVKSDGTTWEGEALRKEFGRQLRKAADRYCPHCALLGDPELQGHAMPWPHDEPQFACEGCGDLVTLEKAKLRGQPAAIVNSWSKSNADLTAQAKAFDRMSIFKCAALAAPLIPQNEQS